MVRDREVALGGFGNAGPRTLFQVGSVTKVFTALLLAGEAERGQLTLCDPVSRYLPRAQGQVTLADLATHTSGLPRLPPSLRWYALASPRDPYARYPAWRLVRDARRALRTASRGAYDYSNFGYGLLGYLLGRAAGSRYEHLVADRILAPLALTDTTFSPPAPTAPPRVAQGHRQGRPVPPWHMGPLSAAGGLYSTATDLARFLQACLNAAAPPPAAPPQAVPPPGSPLAESPLAGAIRATLTPRAAIPGGEIGLAWHHRHDNPRIIWHNGMTGGFSAMIAIDPVRRLGVAVLANSAGNESPLDDAVFRALR